ncbi:MAG: nickel transporter, partial [Actinobacteria bacterium]|nr:nickel transporter [Actinomycetota bacterium]
MRRLLPPVALLLIAFGVLQVASAPPAMAHPLGNFTVNRYSGIEVSGGAVAIRYVLDMAEIPAFQERSAIDTDGDEILSAAERGFWADREARLILSGLGLSVDDRPVDLSLACREMGLRPGQGGLSTLRMEAVYTGRLPAGRVRYVDANDPDRLGWREVTVRAFENASVSDSSVPSTSTSRELLRYPDDLLQSPLDVREATFSFAEGRTSGRPAPEPCGGEAALAEAPTAGGFAALVTWKLTPAVLLFSLLVAFLFGALHALGPGHGKTIMAAYLVGAGARLRHAVSVGIAVSLMHTASVLGLGLIALFASRLFPAEAVYPWLGLLTGAVVLGLGSFLLAGRLRARRAEGGARSDGPHSHPHPHPHPQPSDDAVETGEAAA